MGEAPDHEAADALFASILSDAAKQYTDSEGGTLEDYTKPPMKSVEDLTRQIDLQNERFSEFRAKRHSIFGALSTALKPVEMVGDIVSGAASEVFAPSQNIYSAVMYLVSAAHDVSSAYDAIVELFDQLKDFTSRLEVYVQHEVSASLREKLVTILASLFQVLVLATKEITSGRLKAYFKRLFGSDSPIQPALDKLKALTLGEERQVLAETYGGVSQLKTTTEEVHDLVSQMNLNVESLRSQHWEQADVSHQDRLREILKPSPFPEDFYNSFERLRVDGTGDWIIEDEGFQAWLRGDSKYVWINGSPGTGKSFLSSRLMSWAHENLSSVGYFFFRNNNPETRSILQALRDIAYQLSEDDAFYAKRLMQTLRSTNDIKTVPSAFRKLFIEPAENDSRERTRHIFLDGIDEADPDEMRQLLSELSPNDGERDSKVRVALAGRSYLSETVTFALDPDGQGQIFTTIQVTPERNAQDVSAFIAQGVSRSRVMRRTSPEFKEEVIAALEQKVDGLFILATFMLADVNRMRHARSILDSLETYPKEIHGMLQQTLTNISTAISPEEVEDLNEMLRWVSCAEETLTLEQLEAALILSFGDPPIRLEETLRGQYSCFFELERQDGFSTDDLVKDYERQQRESSDDGNQSGRLTPSGRASPKRSPSPLGRLTSGTPTGRLGKSLSPSRQESPGRSPDMGDPINEMEFRSNKTTTFVTFFHTSVRQFFRDQDSTSFTPTMEGGKIGFHMGTAKLHILKTCLRIFTEKEWFEKHDLGHGQRAIKQYAAWYWQEHLRSIDPATVSTVEKGEIATKVHMMLTDDDVIYDWSIMYEKNKEGLEVLTDRNIKGLRRWIEDPDVRGGLKEDAKDWAAQAASDPSRITRDIGRLYARAWLDDEFKYIPTSFCFKIVQATAYMAEGYSWSHSRIHWSEIPIEKRVAKAAEWAGFPETGHWHRRVGSTYLTQGLHSEALSHYYQALKVDDNRIESCGRIAYCLTRDKRYEEALKQALECAAMEEEHLTRESPQGAELSRSRWRLYKDYQLAASCYHHTAQIEQALIYFQKAMDSASQADLESTEEFEAEVGYLKVLAAENRHEEMMDLLQTLSGRFEGPSQERSRLADLLLNQYNRPLAMDWIPRAACRTGKVDILVERLGQAITAAYTMRDPLRVLYLRLCMAVTCTYNRETDDAIQMFEQISLVEYRPRGNVPTRQGHAVSFQKLATLYKEKALHAGIKTPEAQEWISRLENIQQKQNEHQNLDMPSKMLGSDINVASIYLALFYGLKGREEESRSLVKTLISESLEILSDGDPHNDAYAFDNLVWLFTAADDTDNACGLAHSLRKINPKIPLQTPIESPIKTRDEPKLPEIRSASRSCGQCLDIISLSEEFVLCKFCMDSFCMNCLESIIKKPGNQTTDHNEAVMCRSDHDWLTVPPLDRFLHRGEVLLGGSQVQGFNAWTDTLRKKWDDGTPTK